MVHGEVGFQHEKLGIWVGIGGRNRRYKRCGVTSLKSPRSRRKHSRTPKAEATLSLSHPSLIWSNIISQQKLIHNTPSSQLCWRHETNRNRSKLVPTAHYSCLGPLHAPSSKGRLICEDCYYLWSRIGTGTKMDQLGISLIQRTATGYLNIHLLLLYPDLMVTISKHTVS